MSFLAKPVPVLEPIDANTGARGVTWIDGGVVGITGAVYCAGIGRTNRRGGTTGETWLGSDATLTAAGRSLGR